MYLSEMVVLLVICRERQLTFVSAPERFLGATPRALGPKLSRQARSKSAPAENHLDKPAEYINNFSHMGDFGNAEASQFFSKKDGNKLKWSKG